MNVAERTISINLVRDFTESPGPRFRKEGEFSGQQFREEILDPKFREARAEHARLFVDLDGGYGYAPSFLEEAFGGLVRDHSEHPLLEMLDLKSDDEPLLIEDIHRYIREARG